MRSKKVLLSVTGKSQDLADNSSGDEVRLFTTGELSGDRSTWRLHYHETQPDDSEPHSVTVTMRDGVVTMNREGPFGTDMIFSEGSRFEGTYNTPYGNLDLAVFPTQVRYHVDDKRGEVFLRYQLDIQGQYPSMREMRIRFAASHRS